jgi:hypothetical protein
MPKVVYIVAFGTRKSITKFNNYPTAYRDLNIKLINEVFILEELFKQTNCSMLF